MKETPSRKTLSVAAAVIAIAISFFAGFAIGMDRTSEIEKVTGLFNKEEGAQEALEQVDFAPFWRTWNVINEKYVAVGDDVAPQEKVWGAIQGLASSLEDPYTVFLPPEDAEVFESDISGNFGGVGMEIGMRNGVLTVIAPLRGTPADRAGIKTGDVIVQIDDMPTANLTLDKAVKLIRGEQGTTVTLTVIREGREGSFEVSITRDIIEIPTIETLTTEEGVFVIKLFNFSAPAPRLFRDALREFIDSGSDKLVIDLRGNPGGFLEAAIDVSSWFLSPGKVVTRESFGGDEAERVHRSKGYDVFNDNLKLAILVNGGSASASEIVAGALSEHGEAVLVGEQTFGKGSVQELVKITPETALKVTIARWLTPNGVSISEGGLTPDVIVEADPDAAPGEDIQLDRAIEILTTGI